MSEILDSLRDYPRQSFGAGENVFDQDDSTGRLFVLISGRVEIVKDGIIVAKTATPGAVLGELSALLGVPHTASVRTLAPSEFYLIADARAFLAKNHPACLHVCELLAKRLDSLNKYLVDVKQQFEGHDHIGMVDQVLDTLLHRHPSPRVTPRDSTLRDPEVAD